MCFEPDRGGQLGTLSDTVHEGRRMREKRLYWCPFCERNVSLWKTRDNRLICPRCGREIVYITGDGSIGAIKGKDWSR